MHRDGPLRCSYYVERNTDMKKRILELVAQYNIVKRLAGDQLKRDQLNFIYKIHDMVYNCALKDNYLSEQGQGIIRQVTIPELTVFLKMLHIRDIDDRKRQDEGKKHRKAQERASLGLSEEEEEELKLDLPPPKYNKKGKKIEPDPEIVEKARVAALFKIELAKYGVSYFLHIASSNKDIFNQ